jgi:hypothetical protein
MLRRANAANVCALLFLSVSCGWFALQNAAARPTAFDEWPDSSDEKKMASADADTPTARRGECNE